MSNPERTLTSSLVSPTWQAICIALSLISIISIISIRSSFVSHNDPVPPLDCAFSVPPTRTHTLTMGLYIDEFFSFDILKNSFGLAGSVWYSWQTDKPYDHPELLERLDIVQGTITERGTPDYIQSGDLTVMRIPIRLTFHAPINYVRFPLTDHRICLLMRNLYLDARKININAPQDSITLAHQPTSWSLEKITTISGCARYVLDNASDITMHYPYIMILFNFSRHALRYIITLFLPLLVVFYVALLSLSLANSTGLSVAISACTGLAGYRFGMEGFVPQVGYFTSSDYLFFLILLAILSIIITLVFDTFVKPVALWYKKFLIAILHMLLIGALLVLSFA